MPFRPIYFPKIDLGFFAFAVKKLASNATLLLSLITTFNPIKEIDNGFKLNFGDKHGRMPDLRQ